MYRRFFEKTPTRFIGYCFAFYEAMRVILRSRTEKSFYFVASVFIFLHAVDEALEGEGAYIFYNFIDTLIFEAIASIVIPICIARAAFDLATHLLNEFNIHYQVTRYGPSFLALLSVILVSKPLDDVVNTAMSKSIRRIYF